MNKKPDALGNSSKDNLQLNSASVDLNKKSNLDKFSSVKKLNDPRFGEISIVQNSQSKEFFASKELKFTDIKSLGVAVNEAKNRLGLKHPNLVAFHDYSVSKQSELCSTFYILKVYYEYPKTDLKKELIEKTKKGEKFTGDELNGILNQQNQALNHLHSQGRFHGDLQPMMIGYNRDLNHTKLIDKFDLNTVEKLKLNQKNKLISGHNLYISPASLEGLAKGNLNYSVDPAKEDLYALGLTILELGNQRPINDIYDTKNKKMNLDALKNHLEEFGSTYGDSNPQLLRNVYEMTGVDSNSLATSTNISHTIQGGNVVNVITVKAQPIPMDGVDLFEGYDKDEIENNIKRLSVSNNENGQTNNERKVHSEAPQEQNQDIQPKVEAPIKYVFKTHSVERNSHNSAQNDKVFTNGNEFGLNYEKPASIQSNIVTQIVYTNQSFSQNPSTVNDFSQVIHQPSYTQKSSVYDQSATSNVFLNNANQPVITRIVRSDQHESQNHPIIVSTGRSILDSTNSQSFPPNYVAHKILGVSSDKLVEGQNVVFYPNQAKIESSIIHEQTTMHTSNRDSELSGLKLVRKYVDSSKATDKPNY